MQTRLCAFYQIGIWTDVRFEVVCPHAPRCGLLRVNIALRLLTQDICHSGLANMKGTFKWGLVHVIWQTALSVK